MAKEYCENHVRGMGNDTSRFCINCGYEFASEQWSKVSSEGEKINGIIIQGKRGYFISIIGEVSEANHILKQKEVKSYETRTDKKGQELADYLAAHTTRVRESWNGKYLTSSASIDIRTDEEKAAHAAEQEEMQRQRALEEQARAEVAQKSWEYMTGREYEIVVTDPKSEYKYTVNGDDKYIGGAEYKQYRDAANTMTNVIGMIRAAHPELLNFRIRVGVDPFAKAAEGEKGYKSNSGWGPTFKQDPKVVALTWLI